MIELVSQTATQLLRFGQYFPASRFAERQQQLLVVQRTQPRNIVLVVDQNHRQRGPQLRQGMRTASRTQFWATDAQPIPLQQAVQQQDKTT